MKTTTLFLLCVAMKLTAQAPPMVKITPLGSHAGEFCRNDRALLFEDPTGVGQVCIRARRHGSRVGARARRVWIRLHIAHIAGGEMAEYFARKVQDITGSPTASCPATGLTNEVVVPLAAPCTATLRPGGSRMARMNGAGTGVKIVTVQAFHSNGIAAIFVDDFGVARGTTACGGSAGGFVVKFTNGLTVYLTGDTGMFGDMRTIIRK